MKWPLNQIKSALDSSAQRRDVLDLVQSGTRSVRVISEEKVVQLIEAVVHDALGESAAVDPAERDRLAAQAKAEFAKLARQHSENEGRSQQQQELIAKLQRRVEDLEREGQAHLSAATAMQRQRDDAVAKLGAEAARADAQAQRAQVEAERAQAQAQRAVAEAARADTEAARAAAEGRRTEIESQRAAQAEARAETHSQAAQSAQAALAQAQVALAAQAARSSEVVDRTPQGLASLHDDMLQMQQLLARLEQRGGGAKEQAKDLESRFESAMQVLLDKVGRKLQAASAAPIDNRVEATDALLGKVLESGPAMESNLADLDVSERRSDQSIQRSLERLRKARQAAPLPQPPRAP